MPSGHASQSFRLPSAPDAAQSLLLEVSLSTQWASMGSLPLPSSIPNLHIWGSRFAFQR